MLKRKMLIIANPGEIGDEYYCEGVNKDVENYLKATPHKVAQVEKE